MTSCPDIARLVGELFVYAAWGVLSLWLVLDVVAGGFYDVAKLCVRRLMARRVAATPFSERVRMLEAREEQAAAFRRRIRERIAREDQRHGGEL
ncbi:hypothetical protein [Variovorax paradoxus]|uniref:hypothetical protein n=1 Tax=Variovorax paradoxus TaxID=34073 RepID=UPI0039942D34